MKKNYDRLFMYKGVGIILNIFKIHMYCLKGGIKNGRG